MKLFDIAHLSGGIKTLAQLAQREDHVATRLPGCKNLAHMSKTSQIKRTQMVATASFTIRVFAAFSDC